MGTKGAINLNEGVQAKRTNLLWINWYCGDEGICADVLENEVVHS